ncbi:MAG TPA: YcnI family protein [Pseudonocardiaceae bacterium]|nr:YcnI family protein [Pseudonocardiaceae bacterium]
MSTKRSFALRLAATLTATGVLVLAGAGIASAHVTAHSPDNPGRGDDGEIVFRVPDEEATAHTVKIQVNFSTTSPITNADIKPVPGFTAVETMMTLPKPVHMDNENVTTAVRSITWTAPSGAGIAPGQFQEFAISVEGLPDNTNELLMPTIQTYDNGDVVNWNQPTVAGQPEPDHPTPHLALAATSSDDAAAPISDATSANPPAAAGATSDDTARWLGGVGLIVAALALGFGLGAFVRGRRQQAGASV